MPQLASKRRLDPPALSPAAEAVSILHTLCEGADISDAGDGTLVLTFRCDPDTFERLCLWDSADEDLEPEINEDDGFVEDVPFFAALAGR